MSLRPNARTELRKKGYKAAVDPGKNSASLAHRGLSGLLPLIILTHDGIYLFGFLLE